METALARPASWPLPKKKCANPELFGFIGTDHRSLERQYTFYLRAYGLPEATRTIGPDGAPQWSFHYDEDAEQTLAPNLPARVVEALAYLIEALSTAPPIATTGGQLLLL
jgi:hypothetical protein